MRIRESKNLKYDKKPWTNEDREALDPKICVLKSFTGLDGKIVLYCKNKSTAIIGAKNAIGETEVDSIRNQLEGLVGQSYEEVLNHDF